METHAMKILAKLDGVYDEFSFSANQEANNGFAAMLEQTSKASNSPVKPTPTEPIQLIQNENVINLFPDLDSDSSDSETDTANKVGERNTASEP